METGIIISQPEKETFNLLYETGHIFDAESNGLPCQYHNYPQTPDA